MNKTLFIGLVLAIVFSFICYVASDSIFVSAITFVLTIVYFFLVVARRFQKFNAKIKRFHHCFYFINNFLVSLSIRKSISEAFHHAANALDEEFKEEEEAMKDMMENEKILYLQRYFPFHLYQLFSDIVMLWCEQGGDILLMSNYLYNQARETEEYILYCESVNRKTTIEFSVLWLFSLTILFILRFVLSDFYIYIVKQTFYSYAILGIFLIVLLSIELLTKHMTKIEIRGWNNDTK
ncbi:MAG: hypothetical protein WCS49_02875 [Bacilli bacterium]